MRMDCSVGRQSIKRTMLLLVDSTANSTKSSGVQCEPSFHTFCFPLRAAHLILLRPSLSMPSSIYLISDLTTHRLLARLPTNRLGRRSSARQEAVPPIRRDNGAWVGGGREGREEGGPIGSRHQQLTLDWLDWTGWTGPGSPTD